MSESTTKSLHFLREENKTKLKTFLKYKTNGFDKIANLSLERLKKDHKSDVDYYLASSKDNPFYADLENIEFFKQTVNEFLIDDLKIILELQIIYAHRHLEINLKELLAIAYPQENMTSLYKWENLIQFIKSKNITHTSLDGYKEVNQIREMSNFIKHSDSSKEKVNKEISEFKDEIITYDSLSKFYERVKECPQKFLSSLCKAVYDERYVFLNEKIKTLVNTFVLRMEKGVATKFAEAIISHYES